MRHLASARFWALYRGLPDDVRSLAEKNFAALKADPPASVPPLQARRPAVVSPHRAHHRALGHDGGDRVLWFWIGTHADYDKLIP